jgi:glycosyltransferase involved in cell wall biosynthesis
MSETPRETSGLDLAVIIPELAKYGGAERLLIECVARWQHRHDITIYSSNTNQQLLREHGVDRCVKVKTLSPYFEGQHSILLNAVLLPKVWEREIGSHDIYHTHLWPTHLIDRHPMVWYPHEPLRILHDLRYEQALDDVADQFQRNLHISPKYNYDRVSDMTYEAYLAAIDMFDKLGAPDRIVANSKYTAGYLERVYGVGVTDVVYPGVNDEDFIYQPPDENIFLTVGQLWPHKRIKLIIEAIKHVDNAQLYIVGNGPEKERLQRMAQGLGLGDRVFFLHGLTNLEVQILFSRALAVVFTPMKEPFGIVALEAMAAGKPLIAVEEGGFVEAVDESCAMLVPAEPEQLAEKMRQLRDNKELARRMGESGRRRVKQFTWDRAGDELGAIIEDSYQQWVERHHRPEPSETVVRPLVGIHYYCWFGSGIGSRHWNDTARSGGVSDMPTLGYYPSSSGTTIEAHLRSMEEAGIDFAMLNLHIDARGADAYEVASIENVFSIARQINAKIRFAIHLCPYDCKADDLKTTIEMIRKMFTPRDSYLRLDGEPVLFIFWTGVYDGDRRWISQLDDWTAGFIRVACSLRMYSPQDEHRKTFGMFDGWSLYSPLELSAPSRWEEVWGQAYSDAAAGSRQLRIATVSPGYDDSHLKDPNRENNPYREVARDYGATYQRTIDFTLSLASHPNLVLITSYNEYHENTQIEPSKNHGTRYMDMTREMTRKVATRWN